MKTNRISNSVRIVGRNSLFPIACARSAVKKSDASILDTINSISRITMGHSSVIITLDK